MNRKQKLQYTAAAALLAAGMVATAPAAIAADTGAAANPEYKPGAAPSAEFKKLDVDRDGFLSREETRNIRDFSRAFSEADDNRDGKLDADEFTKAQAVHDRIRAGQFVEDSVITARVKAALVKDPAVSAVAVSVETRKGIVVLSGFVNSEVQARRAAEIALSVRGVVSVKSGLVVKS